MTQRIDQPVESTIRERFGGEEREDNHPAFAVAVVSRGSGSGRSLFQSDLLHLETISLSIHRAVRFRSLNRDWTHPREELIEIEMSLAQWGALISSQGIGSGTPVTLRRTEQDWLVPGIPFEPRTAENVAEVKAAVADLLSDVAAKLDTLTEAVEGKQGVRATKDALRDLTSTIRNAEANAAFAVRSLSEAAEHVVSTARADIESQILQAQHVTGSQASVEAPSFTIPAIEE